ncbi:MAG: 2-C-methyl-D-erythritol 4-phosphate cytidylyltransferase [Tannerella sp.]|jgi:2-C-methyl-D-erythritol 4-phosphate cytidylyltransferase|nr:2-C-methyl-D-erythritol 4-phosphate cytidylyltransferase [Tannerella sp.]
MKQGVIVVAGGQGLRMGYDLPKQFIPVHGKPVLMHTLECFHRWNRHASLLIVLPEAHHSYWNMLLKELNCTIPHQVVKGGETRFDSVKNGLAQLETCGVIGVHDGVRPFVSLHVIETCFRKAETCGAVIPVIPLTETIRKQDKNGSCAVNRSDYCIVQTPQVFRSDWLTEAYRQPYSPGFTDDASVVESTGKAIHLVEGNRENIKITTPVDLVIAGELLKKS